MQDGSATTLSGVDATDPNTLKVALARPDCEFVLRTAHPALSPVPTVAGPASNQTYNDLPIGNGPFKMDGPWKHDTGIRLVRNDAYTAGPKANLDAIEITITPADTGVQTEYNGFLNGQFDWARMPTPVLSQARDANEPKGQWISKPSTSVTYLQAQNTRRPVEHRDRPQGRVDGDRPRRDRPGCLPGRAGARHLARPVDVPRRPTRPGSARPARSTPSRPSSSRPRPG